MGLQRLVALVAKIELSNQSREKEKLSCPSETSPPACMPIEPESMADLARFKAAATDQYCEPNAGEPRLCLAIHKN